MEFCTCELWVGEGMELGGMGGLVRFANGEWTSRGEDGKGGKVLYFDYDGFCDCTRTFPTTFSSAISCAVDYPARPLET